MKIGVRLESMGLPLRRAFQEAERLGVAGVQVDAVGDLAPGALSQTGRREFRHLLRAHSLELAVLGCRLRRGLDVPENQEARIDHVKQVLSLSFDLGPRIAVVQAGRVPTDPDAAQARWLTEALLALGQHGDRVGAVLALETGLESGDVLSGFLARLDTGGLAVALDPANLLINGFDPLVEARVLKDRVRLVYTTDARKAGPNRAVQAVPLGHGDIDWVHFLALLEETEYRDWLVLKQDSGDNRLADIAAGVALLRRLGAGVKDSG
jgi:sugar phosphate isomerase/epimerase